MPVLQPRGHQGDRLAPRGRGPPDPPTAPPTCAPGAPPTPDRTRPPTAQAAPHSTRHKRSDRSQRRTGSPWRRQRRCTRRERQRRRPAGASRMSHGRRSPAPAGPRASPHPASSAPDHHACAQRTRNLPITLDDSQKVPACIALLAGPVAETCGIAVLAWSRDPQGGGVHRGRVRVAHPSPVAWSASCST